MPLHRTADALIGLYGPQNNPIEVVEAIDPIEVEYAALRTHAALLDRPERAIVEVRGADAIEFLSRMLTQELRRDFPPFASKRSFWLSRKGRIDADVRILRLADRLLIDLDRHGVDRFLNGEDGKSGLTRFVFSEEVTFADMSQSLHRLSMHGPAAIAVLHAHAEYVEGAPILELQPDQVTRVRIAGTEVIVDRWDSAGEIGLELTVPTEHVQAVYERLSRTSSRVAPGTQSTSESADKPTALRCGWHAYNLARLETGTALFNLDFGVTTLPHETGRETLLDRVSFKKGCYLGQEVVARMESLGHPKQRLVGLRIAPPPSTTEQTNPFLAEHAEAQTGSLVLEQDSPESAERGGVGAITSAAISPMLGAASIAFAMVKWSHSENQRQLFVQTGACRLPAIVQESLRFWKRA